jgi:hypothetical protein
MAFNCMLDKMLTDLFRPSSFFLPEPHLLFHFFSIIPVPFSFCNWEILNCPVSTIAKCNNEPTNDLLLKEGSGEIHE